MNLSEKLKSSTKAHHAQLDQLSSMRRLTSEEVNLTDYKNYLQAFYLIHSNIEENIYKGCCNYLDEINSNRRIPNLINDLNKLNVQLDEMKPVSRNKFELDDLELLGALYVIEGSRLGGKYIANHLSKELTLEDIELTFLSTTPAIKWSKIVSFLNEQPDDNHIQIIEGAKYTFQYFYDELTAFYSERA